MSWLLLIVAFLLGAAWMFTMICVAMAASTNEPAHTGPMATSGNSPRPKVNPMAQINSTGSGPGHRGRHQLNLQRWRNQ